MGRHNHNWFNLHLLLRLERVFFLCLYCRLTHMCLHTTMKKVMYLAMVMFIATVLLFTCSCSTNKGLIYTNRSADACTFTASK